MSTALANFAHLTELEFNQFIMQMEAPIAPLPTVQVVRMRNIYRCDVRTCFRNIVQMFPRLRQLDVLFSNVVSAW